MQVYFSLPLISITTYFQMCLVIPYWNIISCLFQQEKNRIGTKFHLKITYTKLGHRSYNKGGPKIERNGNCKPN